MAIVRAKNFDDGGAANNNSVQKPKKKRHMNPWLRLLIKLVVLACIGYALFYFAIGIEVYHGENMYPFVMDGDLLILYKLDPYNVGDVVAYSVPDTEETRVSRIVAYGENEVEITDYGEVLLNGYLPAEKVFYKTERLDGSDIQFPLMMKSDEYFLLDDYRTEGYDSRAFGSVTEDAFKGKVLYLFRKRGI